ncbi:MAG: phosphatidylserine decarboxylase [Lachnospiraceae bacterium]|nr:phosphatidylserine decarboxylase [Lachnospiraceae bacterium]
MKDGGVVRMLYTTRAGHALLRCAMRARIDRAIVLFLRSRLSAPFVPLIARMQGIDPGESAEREFASYRALFLRHKKKIVFDGEPRHLVSPCDGYLSAFRIRMDGTLVIKGMRYRTEELLAQEEQSALSSVSHRMRTAAHPRALQGGLALLLRLTPADYHHYHYFDDCIQHRHHYIEGTLHSVQGAALSSQPVFAHNRRTWSVLDTAHFGCVREVEVGAFVVGGIVNRYDRGRHARGEEKGFFDLAGSTIVLLFERGRVRLRASMREKILRGEEVRVRTGERIGVAGNGR